MNKPVSGVHKVPTDHAARGRLLKLRVAVSYFGLDLFLPTESNILVQEVTSLIIFRGGRGVITCTTDNTTYGCICSVAGW